MVQSEQLTEAILSACRDRDGKKVLPCAQALKLAKDHNLPPTRIREICDQQGVKISQCQLGCFP